MRLTLKLATGLVAAMLPIIAVNSGFRAEREIHASEADLQADDAMLGQTVANAFAIVWRSSGDAGARTLIAEANRSQRLVSVRWVSLAVPPVPTEAPRVGLPSRLPDAPLAVPKGASMFTYVAVPVPGPRSGAIEVERAAAPEETFIHHTIRHAAAATGAVVGLCGCLALGLGALMVGRPVQGLIGQTRRIGAGDLSSRLRLRQRDELGQLGDEIDNMCDRLAAARDDLAIAAAAKHAALEQVRHADRLATVGKLAAGIAHEIGTPLNIISGHAQLITSDHEPGTPDHENATIVVQQTQRVAGIIRQLLDFARRRPPRRTRLELASVVQGTLTLLAPMIAERGVTVTSAMPDGAIECSADYGQLQQAVMNLVVNAIQSMSRGGHLDIALRREAANARIDVTDDGSGITSDALPHIFEPFFTTKDVGAGTGLGLSVTYGIVKDHDGWLEVSSTPGQGSRFSIFLPMQHALSANGEGHERIA